eukprot:COSAG01_NODE_5820_length_4014_cov_1.656450_4_plen_486_part_00
MVIVRCRPCCCAGRWLGAAPRLRPATARGGCDLPSRSACSMLAALLCLRVVTPSFTHGWNKVGDMLALDTGSKYGRYSNLPSSYPQWEWLANNYALVVLSNFEDLIDDKPWNCTGESARALAARKLKSINPNIKTLWYQPASNLRHCRDAPLHAHPEWWLRDDHGNLMPPGAEEFCEPMTSKCKLLTDWRVPAAREWWRNQPQKEVLRGDAASLIDGIMADGTGWHNENPTNISNASYAKHFAAKMTNLREAQEKYFTVAGGEVWGNPLMQFESIGLVPPGSPQVDYNVSLSNYGGAFDEMFGSYSTLQGGMTSATGEWDPVAMEATFYAVRNASVNDQKTVVIHATPGPAVPPFAARISGSAIRIPMWAGPDPGPRTLNEAKLAMSNRLVESLAPFLIVAAPTVFFGYGWWYAAESGYTPCDDEPSSCLAPNGFFPEYSRYLGPPKAALATQRGTVWTREFEGAFQRTLSILHRVPTPCYRVIV